MLEILDGLSKIGDLIALVFEILSAVIKGIVYLVKYLWEFICFMARANELIKLEQSVLAPVEEELTLEDVLSDDLPIER